MTDAERADLARFYGFNSYTGLRSISEPLPMLPADKAQSYLARRPSGHWFLWHETPAPQRTADDGPRMQFLKPQ